MKKIIAALIVVTLSGCAVIDKVSEMWPRDHDPGLVTAYVNLQSTLEKVDCDAKREFFLPAVANARWLNLYAEFRSDPQRSTTKLVHDNLVKAEQSANSAVCKRFLNIANINMKTIKQAWGDR